MESLTISWLEALDKRHLADLTMSEVARALRALSSCYVERRGKLAEGGALSSAGKRAAFALFYAPQHFLVTERIVGAIPGASEQIAEVVDLGCGTGSAGAAWAVAAGARSIRGIDRHPWAIAEAGWTYRQFHLGGRVTQGNIGTADSSEKKGGSIISGRPGMAILAAYAANELLPDGRKVLLASLLEAHARGARVLVVEPIARRLHGSSPWWGDWQSAVERAGGRADEWRFPADLPPTQRALGRAAGLDPRELTARTLFLP